MNRNFGALDQIGIVVRHLERVRESMEAIFGILPTATSVNNYEGVSYRGEIVDTAMESLVYSHFGIELQFIAPLGSENVWDDFLQQRGEGIHHLRFQVEDQTAAMLELADQGMAVAQAGDSAVGAGVAYAYFDSVPELGFTVETINSAGIARLAASVKPGPDAARMIPLSLEIDIGIEQPLLLNLIDIDRGHTTLRFRVPEAAGFWRGGRQPVLRLDDGRGTDFGIPVAQWALPPLDDVLQVSFPGVPDPAATTLLIRAEGEPRFEVAATLAASMR
ncbi:VOC family protein [Paeniglutamicibacter cryotolerans]|uniref:Catechol 2,3-dioxygenase-like lactoylglutathione lyase family enzyme n=1 Tax=Paeniglutamicibacter cryotolerans TaxID=670079 RepID=A0A839QDC8_9MICC|nr:VOC family protein [Paeniglutamicibacter cryotolerans]MBB2994149.1 catechol 2,3-dioxygenase-like lactoylglutathione lyase family enzyme [Paeniglutamicibacter cryotolerans]